MEDLSALEGMKRAELQRLAKNAGIKANMKTGAIIQALKKYYSENGSLSAVEGTSYSEDSKTEDESAVSASECASSSANEEPIEQEATENTPPKRAVRRGRKDRKRVTKAAAKPAAAVEPAKTPEQKSATPEADPVPKPLGRATRRMPPKTDCAAAPAKTTPAPTEVPIRRKTRSVTPKTHDSSATVAKITPAPAKLLIRRKTRSVTPKMESVAPTTAAPADVPVRRRTFEIEQEKSFETKAGVQSDPEMKKAIMAELEQKVDEKLALQSRIPKSKTMVAKASKPVTPGNKDWSRIHQVQFKKMESIDDYVARKRKRTETLSVSVKRAKLIADEARAAIQNLTSHRTPQGSAAKIAKLVSRVCPTNLSFSSPKPALLKAAAAKARPTKARPTKAPATKAPASKGPTAKSVTFKMSRLKTPTRAVLLLGGAGEPKQKRKSTPGPRKSVSVVVTSAKTPALDLSSRRKSMGESAKDKRKSVGVPVTPFKFGQTVTTATTTTPAPDQTSKLAFNLKASLSKPLAYKPHTGKLKPLEVSSHFQAMSNIQKAKIRVLKKPTLKVRDNRRAGAKQNRADRRANTLMARRGISAL